MPVLNLTTPGDRVPDRSGPARRVADAILTQAIWDLKSLAGSTEGEELKAYHSAKLFLTSNDTEPKVLRDIYCDWVGLDPAYIQSVALQIIEQQEREQIL